MIVDIHEDDGRDVVLCPGMVSPGLAETVAGDLAGDADSVYSGAEDAPGLDARDRLFIPAAVGEDELSTAVRIVETEGLDSLGIQRNGLILAGFMLGENDVLFELLAALVVNIAPFALSLYAKMNIISSDTLQFQRHICSYLARNFVIADRI